MDAVPFAIKETSKLDEERELITYAADGYDGAALTAITTTRGGVTEYVDLFFWRVTDLLTGHGVRDRVCDISLEKRHSTGKWTAKMSGPSFAFDTADGAKAFAGALMVASAWFALARAEAGSKNKEG